MDFGRVLRTVRWLRVEQLWFQVWRRLRRARLRAVCAPPSVVDGRRMLVAPAMRWHSVSGERFEFLNIADEFRGWSNRSHGMLWAYNQNYFDWLNQEGMSREEGCRWIDRFIADLSDNVVGLAPYPTALRVINWIKFFSRYPEAESRERCDSLYSQLCLLSRRLERHLLGNHLLEDGYALYIGSLFFGDEKMHRGAWRLLRGQLREQVLGDGAHYEQSVMYHSILLDRLLDCVNISEGEERRELVAVAERMLGHLESIVWRSGRMPLVGDAAEGIAPTSEAIFAYARRLGLHWQALALGACGYRKLESDGVEVLVDVGNIMASYQPGHAHADTLSVVAEVDSKPFLVDSGITTYNKTARRQWERSTPAHNTVSIGDGSSSEVWGGFRVGRRAQVTLHSDLPLSVDAAHDGYGKSRCHRRGVTLHGRTLTVSDSVAGGVEAVARYYFSPDIAVVVEGYDAVRAGDALARFIGAKKIEVSRCEVATQYNNPLSAQCVEATFIDNLETIFEL